MIKTTVTGANEAIEAINKAINDFITDEFVTVGIHEEAGTHDETGINNAQLGAIQEFGTDNGRIPPRPWLVPGVNSGNEEYLKIITDAAEKQQPLSGALEQVGVVAASKVQIYMTELKTPPNAPSTIKKKGSSNPLIDTGELRSSVTYKVTNTKPTEGL